MRALPIDPLLPEIEAALRHSQALVLEAAPGAGKTTRVPLALLQAGLAGDGDMVVAEPRRLAARLAAEFVAHELGEKPGDTIGYSVRFEHAVTRRTRIVYATEGVLLRRLIDDPRLSGTGLVILDEFHERHLATDVLLALIDRLQHKDRPDLRLVVMSATLDARAVAEHLGAPCLTSEGRMFPVSIEHATKPDDRPLERQVGSAVRRLLAEEPDGHVLVFLPGAREIRSSAEVLAKQSDSGAAVVMPLHGDLPISEQARAVGSGGPRRVILSTNVAESSVTIDGVTAVVDTGLVRMAGHSPWSGLPTLTTGKISRASATQRAGRAGRTRPGRVIRLYTEGDLRSRPAHDKPEILRDDLAEIMLVLHGAGVDDPSALRFLQAPPEPALSAAETLLRRLGALDDRGQLSKQGRRMLDFPLPPRLARALVEGERRGVAEETCLAAALLSERDLRSAARAEFSRSSRGRIDASGPSDVLEVMDRFREAEHERFDPRRLGYLGLDVRTARTVDASRRKLQKIARNQAPRPDGMEDIERALMMSLLTGFPDRLARRRVRGQNELTLFSGKSARLADTSVVHEASLMITLDADESGGRVIVRLASAVEPDWIFELFPDLVEMTDSLSWNAESGAVERVSRIACGSVVLEEDRKPAPPSQESTRILAETIRARVPPWYETNERLSGIILRTGVLRAHVPGADFPTLGPEQLDAALEAACAGRTRTSDLEQLDLADVLLAGLDSAQRALLDREVPERITLPGGRTIPVHYESGKPPWIESRLQDFFGMVRTPTLCKGRLPLTIHLLAPNQRAVQVTTDIAGFWERHYPGIRKELGRRYPRHAWPEDGRTAEPPRRR